MNTDLAQKAINAALSGKWQEAIELNKTLLSENENDVDCLNRLARAYAETGDVKKAIEASSSVLTIDPFNSIAQKAVGKWKSMKDGDSAGNHTSSNHSFIEEPGKTKIISLIHLGDTNLLCKLDSGDEMTLNLSAHRATVCTHDNKYVGRLPDDLSSRIRELSKHGNEYKLYIKSVDTKEVKVFIRETKRAKKLADIPSFTSEKIEYISFTPPELIHDKDDIVQTVETDEEE